MFLEEKQELERRVRAATTSQRDSLRARIVLLRHQGVKQVEVARRLGTSVASVNKWSQRFDREGIAGLHDLPRSGRPRRIPPEIVKEVVTQAGQAPPGAQRRSTRTLAKKVGIAPSSVGRIWREQGLKPHRTKTFKLSNDKDFERKFWDVIGLYLDPPEKAVVLCCDEKTQCQALERTQPALPPGVGHIRTKTHDYVRHGTIRLFAAMNYLEGKLIYRTEKKAHAPGMAALPEANQPRGAQGSRHPPDRGQLQHAQAGEGAEVARRAQALSHALHTDLVIVDEPSRALLCRLDGGLRASGQFHERQGTDGGHHGVHREPQ